MRIIHGDWRECVELFLSHEIEFLVVGAHALAFHGHPRYTGDLDLFVRNSPKNAARILEALTQFGFGSLGLTLDDFTGEDQVVQLGVAPGRIDILTSLTGISFDDAWSHRITVQDNGLSFPVLSKEDLLRNKQALGRPKDLADAAAIEGL